MFPKLLELVESKQNYHIIMLLVMTPQIDPKSGTNLFAVNLRVLKKIDTLQKETAAKLLEMRLQAQNAARIDFRA